jgi:hypothetical protein
MTPFAPDQWIMLVLVFLLGLVIGMFLLASGKWKRRYREERSRCETLEADNEALRREAREMDSLRTAAAKTPVHREDDPRPL